MIVGTLTDYTSCGQSVRKTTGVIINVRLTLHSSRAPGNKASPTNQI